MRKNGMNSALLKRNSGFLIILNYQKMEVRESHRPFPYNEPGHLSAYLQEYCVVVRGPIKGSVNDLFFLLRLSFLTLIIHLYSTQGCRAFSPDVIKGLRDYFYPAY